MNNKSIHGRLLLVLAIPLVIMSACVKEKAGRDHDDFSRLDDFVIQPNSGLANFWGDAYLYVDPFSPDTVFVNVYVGLASRKPASEDIVVTLAIDDQQRIQFNNDNYWATYLPFTSDMYTLKDTKLTIHKGTYNAQTQLEVYTQQVDFSQTWMLPISITDASGLALTSNLNTMYYHIF